MAVLSIDLAFRSWSDLGIVILNRTLPSEPSITCEILDGNQPELGFGAHPGPVDAQLLASRLNYLCELRNIRVLMLDGPQAWKSPSNGLAHARVSERQLNTAAKTGLPGMVKPVTYRPFAEFCLDVYEALCRLGWRRLDTRNQPAPAPGPSSLHHPDGQNQDAQNEATQNQERILIESYPHAAWKSLGLKPLPSKRRARVSDLAEAYRALCTLIPITTDRPPNHDQLQAIVGGLPGLALEEHNTAGTRIVGNPPRREGGHWREGYIVLPLPPQPRSSIRWLQ